MLWGNYLVGDKKPAGFVLSAIGNAGWMYVGATRGFQLDLMFISLCFSGIGAWNYWKWQHPRPAKPKPKLFDLPTLLDQKPASKSRTKQSLRANGRV
jgi:hypothetical protein